ncbi:MAG: ABC transporter ATP-binding protein/permease [Acetatifactor sp.]|nr:ABC transporter ATP-binding protein/permease [Acetatifactor sp.]
MKKYLFYQNMIRLWALILLQTMRTAGTVGVAVLINMLIDAVQAAIAVKDVKTLIDCGIICSIYAFGLGGVILAAERLKAANIRHIMLNLRRGIVHGALDKRISDYQGRNSAEYITLLNQNLGTFEESYLKNLLSVYDSAIGILIAVILLVWIDPFIAVISIAAMAIPGLIPKVFGKRLGVLQSGIMQSAEKYNVKIKDIFNGFELIKTYQADKRLERLHDESANALEDSKARMADTMALLYALANMASVAVQFLIMTLAGIFAVKGLITIGSIIAVTQLTGQVISPAFRLSAQISQFKAVKPICGQIKENMQGTDVCGHMPVQQEMEHALVLKDVSFSYESNPVEDASAVEHVSLQFDRGKKYAVVGRSGSGKSTLLKLLAGYYDSYSGRILLDGSEGRQVRATLIHQNPFLFDDTIRNNITLYETYPDAAVKGACHLAGLDDLIDSLEGGLDTEVSENGSRFSGGEKQRIAVARAILHREKVFLLDEATSALDSETTNFVEDSIFSLENTTCIAVTHKLTPNSLQKYDEILVMDNGKIVQRGSYDRLLAASGPFSELYSAGMRSSDS